MKRIYLDAAASTPLDPRVLEAMLPYIKVKYGNPSSVHSFGKDLKVVLEECREKLAAFLKCKPKELFFTSGGTENNNFAIKSLVFTNFNKRNKKIVTTTIEHPSVYETVMYLSDRFGVETEFIKPEEGIISVEKVIKACDENTLLVSVMHSNNETGNINDIGLLKQKLPDSVYIHSDTTQSIGKVPINLEALEVDFATVSGHKIYAPKGIGVLYINERVKIDKYMHGGSQERNMRGGTENLPGIVGLATAIEILSQELEEDIRHYQILKSYLIERLNELDFVSINTRIDKSLPNIVNFSINSNDLLSIGEMLLIKLDLQGIAVSSGSACSSGSIKPSRVLIEMGLGEFQAKSSLRVSFHKWNKKEDIDKFIKVLKEIVI
ncbi:MAG: cysteine desulfurase family protein [Ignavibacteria bacterium]